MKIAMVAARFSAVEANLLRKAMATFRSRGMVTAHKEKMVGRMIKRGYEPEFAARCFSQIEGFGEYGFPESHAASFALLVYISSWIKHYYPDVFCAALLNSQPMGFYAPAQIVRDAREHGIEVRPPDVNFSHWDNTLEPVGPRKFAIRLGLRQIDGFRQEMARRIEVNRSEPYGTLEDLKARTGLDVGSIHRLAAADAFRSIALDRRAALWDARALKDAPDLPLFVSKGAADEGQDQDVTLPDMPSCEHVVADYQTLRLSLKAHPMSFLRKSMTRQRYTPAAQLAQSRNGQRISIAGIVLIRQRPGSAKGVCFITLEDETGVANLVVWPKVMEQFRKAIMQSRLIDVHGYVQRDGDVTHVVVQQLHDRSDALDRLSNEPVPIQLSRADEVLRPIPDAHSRHPRNVRIIPKSRDFH